WVRRRRRACRPVDRPDPVRSRRRAGPPRPPGTCPRTSAARRPGRPTAPPRPPGSGLDHDVLDDRVVLDRVHRLVLAVARLLEPAMGHLGGQGEVVVDPDRPELDRLGYAEG